MLAELSPDDFWQGVKRELDGERLAAFVGAGISRRPPCSLPVFNELVGQCVSTLTSALRERYGASWPDVSISADGVLHTPHERIDISSTRPEFVFSLIGSSCRDLVPWVCRVFSVSSYSSEHVTIARLLLRRALRAVVTTNFDLCLENALTASGAAPGSYRLITRTEDLPWDLGDLPVLAKVHGTAAVPDSIRMTLEDENRQISVSMSFHNEIGGIHMVKGRDSLKDEVLPAIVRKYSLIALGQSGRDAQFERLTRVADAKPVFWLLYRNASDSEVSGILKRLGQLQGTVYWTRGDVADLRWIDFDRAGGLRDSCESAAERPQPRFAVDWTEATGAWVTLCNALLPRTLQFVLQSHREALTGTAIQEWGVSYILGSAYRAMGRIDDAISQYDKATRLSRGFNRLLVKSRLGLTYADTGRLNEAFSLFDDIESADDIDRAITDGNSGFRAYAWYHFHHGEFFRLVSNDDQSEHHLKVALRMAREAGDRYLQASVLNSLSLVQQGADRLDEARSSIEASIQIKEEIGARAELGNGYNNIGIICLRCGQFEDGIAWLKRAADWKAEHNDQFGLGSAYLNLASAYLGLKDLGNAHAYVEMSIRQKIAVGDFKRLPSSYACKGSIFAAEGDILNALDAWLEGAEHAVRMQSQDVLRQMAYALAEIEPSTDSEREKAEELRQILGMRSR